MTREVEERGILDADGANDERPVEEVVALLAACLGDQQAAVTGRALQLPSLQGGIGRVFGAYRVVGA